MKIAGHISRQERLEVHGKRADGTTVAFWRDDTFVTSKATARRIAKKFEYEIENDTAYVNISSDNEITEVKR
jgi:hypothetical protein